MKKRNGQRMQNHWYYRMAGNLYELLPKAFTTVLNSSSHGVSSGLAASSDSRGIASEVANVSSNGNDATAVPVLPSIKSNKVIPLKEDNARGAELVAQKANHDAEFDCRENAGCHDPIVVLVPMEAGQSLVSANNNLLSSSMLSMPTLKNNTVATLNHHDSASSVHRPLSRSGSVNSHEKVLQVCWSGMLMNTTQSKTFFEIVAADAEEYDAHPLPRDCENIQEDQEQVYRSLQEQLPQFFSVADPTVRDQSV
ncbi:hypothetical protein EON65_20755 [archaeon]|nr:MAG: hypothetical protein EON65_20755 [archaeon]